MMARVQINGSASSIMSETPENTLVPGSLVTSDTLSPLSPGSTGSVMRHPNLAVQFRLPRLGGPFVLQGFELEDVFKHVGEIVREPQVLGTADLCDAHMDRVGLLFAGKTDIDVPAKATNFSYVDPKAKAYKDHVTIVKLSDKIAKLKEGIKYDDKAAKTLDDIINKAERKDKSFKSRISHFAHLSRQEHRRVRTGERDLDAVNIIVKNLQQKIKEASEAFELELEAVRGELIEANEGRKYAEEQSERVQKERREAKEELVRLIKAYTARLETMTTERDDHREKCELLEVQLARCRQTLQAYHQSALTDRDRRSDEEEAAATDGSYLRFVKQCSVVKYFGKYFGKLSESVASFRRRRS